MYLGRYTLGQFVPLVVVTIDGNYSPAWPPVVPFYTIYNAAGSRVFSGEVPPMDLARATGSFAFLLRLDTTFAAGHYIAVFDWTIGGIPFREENRWEVVDGGHTDGAHISMHHYRRPHADFVLTKLDSQKRFIGRDPGE